MFAQEKGRAMARRGSSGRQEGGVLAGVCLVLVGFGILAAVSSLSFWSLVRSAWDGVWTGFGVLAPAPLVLCVIAIVVWRKRRRAWL